MDPLLTDEERLEQIKKWWKTHGMSLLAGLALGISVVWGWGYYKESNNATSTKASIEYYNLTRVLSFMERKTYLGAKTDKKIKARLEEVEVKFEEIIRNYGGTVYAIDSALVLARRAIAKNDLAEANKRLQWAIGQTNTSGYKHHIIRLRLARVQRDQKKYADALKTLSVKAPSQFSIMYSFVKGTVFERQKQCPKARSAYQISIKVMEAQDKKKQVQFKDLKQTIQRRLENVQNC
ncbi:hypothetical protein MNBD_GAMMA12-3601 [hydrothermal vent metagenome]|uniref:Ancillary SecYEG translocon subunit n=1 Tax=hydrothermal vent metagenome TaxID=652676 RepID=A0A3B0YJ16_9ZZZZ